MTPEMPIIAFTEAEITHGSKYGSFTKIWSRPNVSGNVMTGFAKYPLMPGIWCKHKHSSFRQSSTDRSTV